jgi:hypothetical protein
MRLGDLLVKAGVVSQEQLGQALKQQESWGGKLGTILVRMGALSEDLLVKALSRQLKIPRADLNQIDIPPPLRSRLTKEVCLEYGVMPLRYDSNKRALVVAVSDPFNVVVLDDLSARVNLRLETQLAGEQQIEQCINHYFGHRVDSSVTGEETGMRLLNNQNSTLIKKREEIARQQQQRQQQMSMPPGPLGAPAPNPTQAQAYQQSAGPKPGPAAGADPRMADLEKLATKQVQAVRAILELLIEKGVLSREEYTAWISQL